MVMQMLLPHLASALEMALDWPHQSEDRFAEMFAGALHCSKAAVWVPDPQSPHHLIPVGTHGLTLEERELVQQARLNLEEEKLGKMASRSLTLTFTEQVSELGELERCLMNACDMTALYCCALSYAHQPLGLIYAAASTAQRPDFQGLQKAAEVVHALTLGLHRQVLLRGLPTPPVAGPLVFPDEELAFSTRDGKIVDVNEACLHTFGYAREDLLGQDFDFLVHPDDLNATRKAADLLSPEGERFSFQNRCLGRNG